MSICRRFIATVTMSFQLILTGFGALTVCVDRPHTHGGVPAPDCAMHHAPTDPSPAATTEHHHHGAHQAPSPDTPQWQCRCASDPLPFLVADNAAVPDVELIPIQRSTPAIDAFAHIPLDLTAAPALPPPRLLLV